MPGATYIRGKLVAQALSCGKLTMTDIDTCVRRVLELGKRVAPLGIKENAPENTVDTPETAALLREIGSGGIVLMKNEKNVLPFSKEKSIAVIGPNGDFAAYSGGGSASLLPYYARTPLGGVQAQASDVKYELGAPAWKELPHISRLTRSKDDKPGLTMNVFLDPPSKKDRQSIDEVYVANSYILLVDYKHPKIKDDHYYVELSGTFTPTETADYEFSLSVAGTGKVHVNDQVVVDNETKQRLGDAFFGSGSAEERGSIPLNKDTTYNILVTFGTLPTMTIRRPGATQFGAGGLRVGLTRKLSLKEELDRAVELAKSVDQVLICAGLNSEWESEGYDRETMDLPPGSDELISAVVAANPNTAVCIQSGTPVTMPWLSSVPALIHAWYGGNETGNAIADVVFGATNPSGKLPLSFPLRNEDNPAFLNYKSERGRTIYGEDVYIGYRFYDKTRRAVAFPFGHGLSYTTFDMSDLSVRDEGDDIAVTATVANTGDRDGAQVVQVYVAQQKPTINRPPKELKGFRKVFVKSGAKKSVEIKINKKYAASFWDEGRDSWVMEKDTYDVLVGDSSQQTPLKDSFEVEQTSWWRGL